MNRDSMAGKPKVSRHLKNFLRPCILLVLKEGPVHGYFLADQLRPFGFPIDRSRIYVELRSLEREALIRASSDSESNQRRSYELSAAGNAWLHQWANSLAASHHVLALFLTRYGEAIDKPATVGNQTIRLLTESARVAR